MATYNREKKLKIKVFERNIEKNTHEEDTRRQSDKSTEEKFNKELTFPKIGYYKKKFKKEI